MPRKKDDGPIPQKALTHAGVFHADDVFATALLTLLFPSIEVMRSNTVPEGFDGIVYDIGGGEFDHHGDNPIRRQNGVPYSSFGLLWKRYGMRLLDEEDAHEVDEGLVQPIDLSDNTGAANPLSLCVKDFNPLSASSPQDFDKAFWEAVVWARGILERRIRSLSYARSCARYVRDRMRACDGRVLVLDRMVPWKQAVVGSGYAFVVYPSLRGGFNVQGVPVSLDDSALVLPFPKAWRGRDAATLRQLTGIQGFTFCHASGFLAAVGTAEEGRRLARLAMGGQDEQA